MHCFLSCQTSTGAALHSLRKDEERADESEDIVYTDDKQRGSAVLTALEIRVPILLHTRLSPKDQSM